MYDLFSTKSHHNLTLLNEWHIEFYGENIDAERGRMLQENFQTPLSLVSKFVADGYLLNTGDITYLDRFIGPKIAKAKVLTNLEEGRIEKNENGMFISRGECLIINQLFENVKREEMKKYCRAGSQNDETELIKTWQKLGCRGNIRVERDLTISEMLGVLKEFRQKLNSSSPDFITIIVLSHGKRNNVTGTEYIMDINMQGLPISRIKNMFIDGHKCPVMLGRPKFFFIQACRGNARQVPQESYFRYI